MDGLFLSQASLELDHTLSPINQVSSVLSSLILVFRFLPALDHSPNKKGQGFSLASLYRIRVSIEYHLNMN
jgi:hypothetical protein